MVKKEEKKKAPKKRAAAKKAAEEKVEVGKEETRVEAEEKKTAEKKVTEKKTETEEKSTAAKKAAEEKVKTEEKKKEAPKAPGVARPKAERTESAAMESPQGASIDPWADVKEAHDRVLSHMKELDAKAAEERLQRKRYKELKKMVFLKEDQPTSKIIMIKQRRVWWRFFGKSALIFKYEIADRIGFRAQIFEDGDYDYQFESGVVNIKNADYVIRLLANKNYGVVKQTPDYCIFNARKMYSLSDIEALRHKWKKEWGESNQILMPKNVMPTLYSLLREFLSIVYASVSKMDKVSRELMGNDLFWDAEKAVIGYGLACNGKGLIESGYLKQLDEDITKIRARLACIASLRALPPSRLTMMGYKINSIRNEITTCKVRKV